MFREETNSTSLLLFFLNCRFCLKPDLGPQLEVTTNTEKSATNEIEVENENETNKTLQGFRTADGNCFKDEDCPIMTKCYLRQAHQQGKG